MWTRVELKSRAKLNVKAFYWPSVLTAFILNIVTANGGDSNGHDDAQDANVIKEYASKAFSNRWFAIALSVTALTAVFLVFVGICIHIFLINPLEVGCRKYFLDASNGNSNLNHIVFGFKNNYSNIVKVLFFRNIYIFLWSLLLIIPGIIKAYEYRMIPYLLSENPNLTFDEAKEKSSEIMYNQKFNAFILDLSFILWHIASSITFGLVGLFWVGPYKAYTDTELYKVLTNGIQQETV